ncbi:MAG: NADPH-dependent oxidoreductase [Haloplasmataceae bacterium]|jgi:FMN reductase [NAD(P)H]|nr:NADPH-dependent oxidoreductase [Haloplasmataceae bacterium]
MNEVIKTILNHRSIRNYTDELIKEDDLNLIIECAQSAPSSINGQQASIIVVKNKERKTKLAELCGNQPYINEAPIFLIFCMDFYRAKLACEKNNVSIETVDNIEATLIGSIDVGLAMQNAINSAESLGLGTVPIGGIRSNPSEVIKLLELPQYVFPLCGLVVGHIKDHSELKPRLPKLSVMHEEKYNHDLKPFIDQYDETMTHYMLERTKGKSNRDWSRGIADYSKNKSTRPIKEIMKNQSFNNE